MSSTTAEKTIEILRSTFARFGLPETIVSDNGPPFTSADFENFLTTNGIKHILTAPYHPASNGIAENAVKNVKLILKKAHAQGEELNLALTRYLFNYRTAKHCTSEESPAKLMFGRELRTRLELIKPFPRSAMEKRNEKFLHDSKIRDFEPGENVLVKDFTNAATEWTPAKIAKNGVVLYMM